jgi:hypothetical protein
LGALLVALKSELAGVATATTALGVVAQALGVSCKAAAAVLAEHTFKTAATAATATAATAAAAAAAGLGRGADKNGDAAAALSPPSPATVAAGQALCGAALALPLALVWDFWLVPGRGAALARSARERKQTRR